MNKTELVVYIAGIRIYLKGMFSVEAIGFIFHLLFEPIIGSIIVALFHLQIVS